MRRASKAPPTQDFPVFVGQFLTFLCLFVLFFFLSLSPDSLVDSLETSTRDEEAQKKKGSEEGGGTAGPSKRPEDGGDGSQPRVQVSV